MDGTGKSKSLLFQQYVYDVLTKTTGLGLKGSVISPVIWKSLVNGSSAVSGYFGALGQISTVALFTDNWFNDILVQLNFPVKQTDNWQELSHN